MPESRKAGDRPTRAYYSRIRQRATHRSHHKGDAVATQPRNSVSLLFYSYPPALISEWCGVTLHHAYRLKAGTTKPSKSVLKLFELYARNRVLGAEWKGWRVQGDRLVDPEGGDFTENRLRGYSMVMQYAAELARNSGEDARDRYFELLEGVA